MARFIQSKHDFPLTVSLGNKAPAGGLSRWGAYSGLRFIPPDDEGFTLRGDTRRLVYKGRRRSHRFTILADGAFEYDVILNKEPESNVVVLPMEGAEQFDFFRQPDFLKDPLLAGSYAVYKKETLIGEGTGKLCHIHRPEIIDARGRRCRGDLSIVGNCLCITIPEQWLAEAEYPVVVDPTIGTTTVGSQIPESYTPSYSAFIVRSYAANPFIVPEDFEGMCTAHVYLYHQTSAGEYTPILFKDFNNKPKHRLTTQEQVIDCSLRNRHNINITYPPQWKTAQFNVPEKIYAGSPIWFGGYGNPFTTKFDYGGILYKNAPELICVREGIGEYYDEEDDKWRYDEGEYIDGTDFYLNGKEKSYNFIFSWYFDYTPSSQNYVRTITQGVTLTDTRKLSGIYQRNTKQSVKVETGLQRLEALYRNCIMTAGAVMNGKCYPVFFRKVNEAVKVRTGNIITRSLMRSCIENISLHFGLKHSQCFFRSIFENVKNSDSQLFSVVLVRVIADKAIVYEVKRRTADYIKTLEVRAGNTGGTAHEAEYSRFNMERINVAGGLFRGLIMLVRLFSALSLRDYIFGRFLKAREELKLKSCISREIILDSKII